MNNVALVLASVAIALSLVTAGLLLGLMHQNGETTADLRAHRLAHTEAFGHPDPKLDRRQVKLGAPRDTGERRGRHYQPPPERLAPRPVVTPEGPAEPETRGARLLPGSGTLAPPADLETTELEQQDLPTTTAPATQRPRPREDTPR